MDTREDYTTAVNRLMLADSPYHDQFQGIMPAVSQLYYLGDNFNDLMSRPRVAIVGSRKITAYGQAVTAQFAGELARQGVVIVSGLAYGVDAAAHRAALEAGGLTVAILPSAVTRVYPTGHTGLARRIVEQGGALVSEYPPGSHIAYKSQFVARNRIVAGISDALLITEAVASSGTMHTVRFALDMGRDVLAVPGNITSPASAGTNNLIKSGAQPVTAPEDVLAALGISARSASRAPTGDTSHEQLILNLIDADIHDGSELLARSSLGVSEFNTALTMMELTGKVRSHGANQWSLH